MSKKRKAITRLTLDLAMPDIQKGVTCTLGDINRKLNVLVTNGGDTFEVLPQWSVILSGTKPDGTVIFNGCVVDDGNIIYDFESGNQISTCAGGYGVTLWIFDEDGDTVAMPKFWINVIDSGIEQILESNDQFTVLQDLVGDIAALQDKDKQVDAILEELRNLIGNGGTGGGGSADLTSIVTNLSKLNIESAQMKEDIEELQEDVAKNTASIESILQNGVGGGGTGGSGASVTTGQLNTNFDAPAKAGAYIMRSIEPGTTIFFMPASSSSRKLAETVKVVFEPMATKGSDGYYRARFDYEEASTQMAYFNWIAIKDPASTSEPRVALVGVDIVGASGGDDESGTGSGSGTGGSTGGTTGGNTTTTDLAQTGEFTINPGDWDSNNQTSVYFPSATNGTLTIIKPKTSSDNILAAVCKLFMVWGVYRERVQFWAQGDKPTDPIAFTWITVKSSNTSTSPMVILDANKGSGSGGSVDLSSITASLTSLTNTVNSLSANVRDLTNAGTITIFSSDWVDGTATYSYSNAGRGTVTLLTPLNSTIRDEVARCKMWATVTEGSLIIHLEDGATPPQATMIFSVFNIKDKENTSYAPMAAIVGVNVNGDGGGTGDVVPVTCDTESTFNSWTVHPSNWTDGTPYEATTTVSEAVNGTVTFVIPTNADTRSAAASANMWVEPIVGSDGVIVLKRLQSSSAPSKTMSFTLFTIKDNNASASTGARAVLLGVDAVGAGGDGTVDLTEIKEDIAEMTTLSSCTIFPRQWDIDPEKATFTVTAAEKGTITFVLPAMAETKDEVTRLGITVDPELSETKVNDKPQYVLNFFRANTDLQTDVYLNFILFTIKDKDNSYDMAPRAVMVGVDAPVVNDGGGVDLSAVEYLTDINTITIARSEWESNGTAKYSVSKYVAYDNTATMIFLSPKDEDTLTESERCNLWVNPVVESGKINIHRPVGVTAPEHDLVFTVLIVKDYEQNGMENSVATVSLVGVRSEGSGFGDVDLTEIQKDIDKAFEDISNVAQYTTVSVNEADWTGDGPYTATVNCSAGTGTITLVAPKDAYTRGQAKLGRIEVNPDVTDGKITLTTGADVAKPSGALTFVLFTVYDKERTAGNQFAPCAALVGVDSVGEGGGDVDVPPEVFSQVLTIGKNDWSGTVGAMKVQVSAAGKGTTTLLVPYNDATRTAVINHSIYVDSVVSEGGDVTFRYSYAPDEELKFFATTVKDLNGSGNTATAAIIGVDYIKPPEAYYHSAGIAASLWSTSTSVTIPIDSAVNGTVTLVLPANDATRKEAASHRLAVNPDASGGKIKFTYGSDEKPDTDLAFTFMVVHDLYSSQSAKAALVGVDAVGGGGGSQAKMELMTIPTIMWDNSQYQYTISDNEGAVVLVMPANLATKEKAEEFGVSVNPALTDSKVVFQVKKTVDADLNFIVFTIPSSATLNTRAALVGVDKQGKDDDDWYEDWDFTWIEEWNGNVEAIIDNYLQNRDDELEARVQALEEWKETADVKLGSVAEDLEELTKEGGTLDTIETKIQGHSQSITSLSEAFGKHDIRLDDVEKSNATQDSLIIQHNADIETLMRKPTGINLMNIKSAADFGSIIEIFSDGSQEITNLTYDSQGRITKIEDHLGHLTTITW